MFLTIALDAAERLKGLVERARLFSPERAATS